MAQIARTEEVGWASGEKSQASWCFGRLLQVLGILANYLAISGGVCHSRSFWLQAGQTNSLVPAGPHASLQHLAHRIHQTKAHKIQGSIRFGDNNYVPLLTQDSLGAARLQLASGNKVQLTGFRLPIITEI